jgi:hypothetical protein
VSVLERVQAAVDRRLHPWVGEELGPMLDELRAATTPEEASRILRDHTERLEAETRAIRGAHDDRRGLEP